MPTSSTSRAPIRLQVESPKGQQTILAHTQKGNHGSHVGQPLTAILRHEGLPLNTRCGERGLCDGCVIELLEGALVHTGTGQTVRATPGTAGATSIQVRGCEHRVAPGQTLVSLRIPARSLLAHQPLVVSEFKINVPWAYDPLIASGGQPGVRTLAAAVDIGTTTVALVLVDLASGEIVGRAASFNRQMHLGDDVVTRINLCMGSPEMLAQLQQAVVKQTIAPLLHRALKDMEKSSSPLSHGERLAAQPPGESKPLRVQEASAPRLAGLVMAGNSTMLHLLAGVDPSSMGVAPFTPTFLDHRILPAHQVGLEIPHSTHPTPQSPIPNPKPPIPIHLLPGAAAYIGADLVAGIMASGLVYDDGPSLLVDVGTNGEIILKHGDTLLGCATAARPAFEGSRLASGIRAGHGAISDIRLDADPFAVHIKVIGNEKPIGLCGSAYIDFLAEARRVGLLTPAGRFDAKALPEAAAREHLEEKDGHAHAFRVASGKGQHPLIVSEADIASLLQAKAAIAAGIVTLLHQAGLEPRDIKTLYLAGGFGTHMDRRNAIGCGLLPGFTPEQIQVVGNSSLAGAYLALVDESVLQEMNRIAKRLRIVELNLVPEFEGQYIDQLMLP